MSDQEVDLNALIESDRRKRRNEKQKRRQQYRKERAERYESRRGYNNRERSRDNWREEKRRDQEAKNTRKNIKRNQRPRRQFAVGSYAISSTGFVSDISLDDILKLAKGKKIINIKAFLEREDMQPIEPGKDNAMTVIINFVEKNDADEFIKEYSDQKLDGKNPMVFQFRRGIVSRRPQGRKNEQSGSQDGDKSERKKSQEDESNQQN